VQPLQSFTTNPAGAAIVNAMGPIRQLVETDAKAQRRYLVIAPLNGTEPGAPVQVQVPWQASWNECGDLELSAVPTVRLPLAFCSVLRNCENHVRSKSRRFPCVAIVPKFDVLKSSRLSSSEKQVPQIVENVENEVTNGGVGAECRAQD
jgi:hypothetical protein